MLFRSLSIAPVLVLFGSMGSRAVDENARGPDVRLIGIVVAMGPVFFLVASGVATMQIIKPLWMLPLASSVAVGLALLFPAGSGEKGLAERTAARIAMIFSAALFFGFCVYLVVAGMLGKTLAAYSADARALSAEIEQIGRAHV